MSEMESHTSCPVCHEGIDVYAIGCCDHSVCYKCSCRMRVLCEQFYCPICRTDLPQVYFVKEDMKYAEIPHYGYIPNRQYKMFFQSEKIKKLFDKLLENRCKLCTHARPERTFKDLQKHIQREHTLFYCDLCIEHLKLFPHERKYYNRHDLAVHRRQGDKDDSSYKGHPLCQFCDQRYLDNDELYRHLRKDHFYCHFCDPEGSREFYNDYRSLKDHFQDKHYLCQEGACSGPEIRLTHAFQSKIDLQAHVTAEHGNNLTKAQAKQLRTIDIDYRLTPRDRRRDRGIVTGADYEDTGPIQTKVYHNSRGGRGGSGRQRHEESRGFKKGNFSEAEMQKAINASLDVMKETKKEEPVEVKEEEKVVHDAENFPMLGNINQERLRVDSPVSSDQKDSDSEALDFSMAKQLALKNKRSVQYGRLISEEFPTLPGEPSSSEASVTKNKPSASKLKENKTQPASKPYSANKGPPPTEDFPGLPTRSSTDSALGKSWVPKKSANTVKSKPVESNVSVISANNNTQKSTSNKKPKTFKDDNDFPTLGGQAAGAGNSLNWLKKAGTDKNKPKQEKKTIDWFDGHDNFEYSMENVKKQAEVVPIDDNKTNNSDTKKKKKKKEKNKTSENNYKSKGGDASLDSIASTLLSKKVENEVKQDWSKNQAPKVRKMDSEIIDSPRNGHKEDITKPDSPKFLRKEDGNADFVSELIEKGDNKFAVLSDDSISIEKQPFKAPRKKGIEVKLDDFPALGKANPSKAAPPGFVKPSVTSSTTKPPGFDDVSLSARPPPGFSMPTSSQSNGHNTTEKKSCNFTLQNIMPLMSEKSNFDYVPLSDSKSRNQKLIQDIMKYASQSEDGFDNFKAISGSFRQGSASAKEYYHECEKIIGKENFENVFPELLVLLPDIDRQQQLLACFREVQGKSSKLGNVVRISGKSADAPWKQTANFQSCPTCRQVVLSGDINDHSSVHSNTSDFPTLSGGGSGPGLRAWVKGK